MYRCRPRHIATDHSEVRNLKQTEATKPHTTYDARAIQNDFTQHSDVNAAKYAAANFVLLSAAPHHEMNTNCDHSPY